MFRIATLLPLLVLSASACTTPERTTYQVTESSSGVRQVANTGEPLWNAGTQWSLVLEGDLVGDGDLGTITALAVAPTGESWLLDASTQRIHHHAADGSYLGSVGGSGAGPGEFRRAESLHVDPDGAITVVDPGTSRYTTFAPDGTLRGTAVMPVRGSAPFGGWLSDGSFVAWETTFPQEGGEVVGGRTILHVPIRLAPSLAPVDTFPALAFKNHLTADGSRPQVYFANRLRGFQDADGAIWFANSREYRIVRRTLGGDTTLAFTLPAPAVPVTEADREQIRSSLANRPQLVSGYLEGLPSERPVVVDLFGDGAGHIFVVPEVEGVPAGTVIDVFRTSGEYLGRLALPVPMGVSGGGVVAAATPRLLVYVGVGADDLPRVVRVRFDVGHEP